VKLDIKTVRSNSNKKAYAEIKSWVGRPPLDVREVSFVTGFLQRKAARNYLLTQIAWAAAAISLGVMAIGFSAEQLGVGLIGCGGAVACILVGLWVFTAGSAADSLIDAVEEVQAHHALPGRVEEPVSVAKVGRWHLMRDE
jgi:hypothetical protein